MKQTLLFTLCLILTPQAFAADTLYWTFNSNSNTKKTTACAKMKEKEFTKLSQEMGCIKVFASGILFCSEKRVLYFFPDEKQCLAHRAKIR